MHCRLHLRLRAPRAMTLMELMIVVTIIIVLMGVSFPTMRSMHQRGQLRSSARELMGLMKLARTEAVLNERPTSFFMDTDSREFWLDLREPAPPPGSASRSTAKRLKSEAEEKRALPRDVWFEEVSAYDKNVIQRKIVAVDFFPDGSATPTLLTLAHRNGDRMTVELVKATGLPELSRGTMEDKRERGDEVLERRGARRSEEAPL